MKASSHPQVFAAAGLLATGLVLTSMAALVVGTTAIPVDHVWSALVGFDGSRDHLVIWTQRLPRVLIGAMVGAALASAGAIMQAVTSNPLASPGLLGINAGAVLAVVLAIVAFGTQSGGILVWYAFFGAATAAVIVYALGAAGRGGATPLKLALAGAIFTAFTGSVTTAILLFDQSTLDQVRLWTAGTLSGRTMSDARAVAPYVCLGLIGAILFSPQVMTLSLGGEIARAVGQNQTVWRGVAAIVVVLLAGSAVALAGPVGFVGLIVPHIVRLVVGIDYRRVIPLSMLGGALLVVNADTCVRLAMPEQDLPVGVTMAILGAPFFIWLARFRVRAV